MKLIATKGHYVFFYYVFSSFIPSPGDLPNPGTEPVFPISPAMQADSLLLSHQEPPKDILVATKLTRSFPSQKKKS